MKLVAVIMAGGRGERFWPQSRGSRPKQFLSLTGDGVSMLQHTIRRLSPLVTLEDIFVVTNRSYTSLVKEQLPGLPKQNILAEPAARNTAPCIALAAAIIEKRYGNAVMLVLPSDHLIKNVPLFQDTLSRAAKLAKEGSNLLTMGITPSYPETGYGYIQFGADGEDGRISGVYPVSRFVEKPDLRTAKEYLASGQYLWNSGMFVWKSETILSCFEHLLPEMYSGAKRISSADGSSSFDDVLQQEFEQMESISIDYGIMEKADNIFTIPCSFGWDDVGSWLALERINPSTDDGNTVSGDVITIDTKNSVIVGNQKLIALVGVEDLVVVDSGDALLICGRNDTQGIKKVLQNLRICNRHNLL